MADYLPEDVIVRIMQRLPIKSLIRFTCVSKRWRFIILSDPEFAMSQFQIASHHQTLCHRLLICTVSISESFNSVDEFNSLDLDTPPPSPLGETSLVLRKVRCPLTQHPVTILCSCNGLILAALYDQENKMFIWNPSTQFFKKLPDPADLPSELLCFGFGYLLATDDYKVIANFKVSDDYYVDEVEEEKKGKEMHIFSSKANTWKRTEAPLDFDFDFEGTLSNEVLHWPDNFGIFAFDLAREEFRRMPLPIPGGEGEFRYVRAFGDCLCAFDFANLDTASSIDLWVMKKYGVADSWTKLFNLKVSDQPEKIPYCLPVSLPLK
ncbi:F-box protein CPR1-like isoform X3 [Rosa rugosa]|uniref:F-box protein CPR1-like isoform X3 n=1 Tax=Rosa rugosa TaxID=74645 RepID=UPI002B414791|nr:F-box protein CPR1-like isoform X3 [Rosa rugosa]